MFSYSYLNVYILFQVMARLEDTEKRHNTHMVRTIRVCLYRTRMVRKIVPYAYGMYHTRMVHAIRVRYKIRIWYSTCPNDITLLAEQIRAD